MRYAQGNGVHEAVGVLRDETGDDRYMLSYGVGQGMGLDLALGVLYDAAGDDRYEATVHAQGNATENGIGVLFDRSGADAWHMSADRRAWGRAEPARRLPSLALVLYEPRTASFLLDGKPVPPPVAGGPGPADEQVQRWCPAAPSAAAPPEGLAFVAAVRSLEFAFRGRAPDARAHAYVRERLANDLERALRELPRNDFVLDWILGNLLPCVLRQAALEEAQAMWSAMEQLLDADAQSPFAMAIALALRERPAPRAQLRRIVQAMRRHHSCMVRSAALLLENSARAARASLSSSCWLLQATALAVLDKLGAPIPADAPLPSFMRRP